MAAKPTPHRRRHRLGQSPGGGHALGLADETRARPELTRGDSDALDPCVAQRRTSATRDTLSRIELMVASALAQARRGDPTARYRRLRPRHQLRGSGLRARVGDPNGRSDRQSERGSRRTSGRRVQVLARPGRRHTNPPPRAGPPLPRSGDRTGRRRTPFRRSNPPRQPEPARTPRSSCLSHRGLGPRRTRPRKRRNRTRPLPSREDPRRSRGNRCPLAPSSSDLLTRPDPAPRRPAIRSRRILHRRRRTLRRNPSQTLGRTSSARRQNRRLETTTTPP